MSDLADLPDEEMDWDEIAKLQARYEATFAALNRRRLNYLEAQLEAIKQFIAERQTDGHGPYL